MNNVQLYLSIGIPSVVALISWITVILAWLSNRSDINRLNDKVDNLGESLRTEMLSLRREIAGEMLSFRRDIAAEMLAFRQDVATEMIAFRREVHSDLILIHERVVKVETRQDV